MKSFLLLNPNNLPHDKTLVIFINVFKKKPPGLALRHQGRPLRAISLGLRGADVASDDQEGNEGHRQSHQVRGEE